MRFVLRRCTTLRRGRATFARNAPGIVAVVKRRSLLGGVLAGLLAATGPACSSGGSPEPDVVVGVPEGTSTSTAAPRVIAPPEEPALDDVFVEGPASGVARAEPPGGGLSRADGTAWPPPIPFTTTETVPDDLVFVLVAGSDARPREDLLHSRADSIHLLAVNPGTGQGTLLGLPRDSWVEIPGHGRGKINNALTLGGPDLLAATVRRLTGLPVHFYVLTGFVGLAGMVDELGGVDVLVDRRMNDRASGARFERGWHRFNGAEALAYTRNRNDVANGDFSRSEHQGTLMLSALAKMRSEVGDDGGVRRWVDVLLRHVKLDVPLNRLPTLGALARRLDPGRLRNVVAPGRIGTAARQSVVFLTKQAAALFEDLRADAVIGTPEPEPEAPTTAAEPSTTTTTGPEAEPSTTSSTAPEESTTTTTGVVPGIIDGEDEGEGDGDDAEPG